MLSAASAEPSQLSAVLDVIDKVIKILAVLIGGGWAYLNYRRGRTFKRRLEPSISGKTIRRDRKLFLSGLAQLKNVGLSKVVIEQEGTAIEVIGLRPLGASGDTIMRDELAVLPVFESHGWIEPGEPIQESFFLPVPSGDDLAAIQLRLRIVSKGIEWNGDSTVEIATDQPAAPANGTAVRRQAIDVPQARVKR